MFTFQFLKWQNPQIHMCRFVLVNFLNLGNVWFSSNDAKLMQVPILLILEDVYLLPCAKIDIGLHLRAKLLKLKQVCTNMVLALSENNALVILGVSYYGMNLYPPRKRLQVTAPSFMEYNSLEVS